MPKARAVKGGVAAEQLTREQQDAAYMVRSHDAASGFGMTACSER
jgi:hypothetical protein